MKPTKRLRWSLWSFPSGLAMFLLCLNSPTAAWSADLQPVQIDRTVEISGDQSFADLVQQAELAAAAAVNQAFAASPTAANVVVNVAAERNGQEVPLLSVAVSRSQWQQQPRVVAWARYLSDARLLLGYGTPTIAQAITAAPPVFGDGFDYTDPRY